MERPVLKKSRKNSRSIQTDRPGAGGFRELMCATKTAEKIKNLELRGLGSRALNVVELLLGLAHRIKLTI
jgi:hypothetical protein